MNDVRPIDANALFDALRDNEFQTLCPLDEVDAVIAAAPTLDYAPVRHGEWIRNQLILNRIACSECKCYFDSLEVDLYCPNCGAKMDGGKNHA